jgi:hypothetical protein
MSHYNRDLYETDEDLRERGNARWKKIEVQIIKEGRYNVFCPSVTYRPGEDAQAIADSLSWMGLTTTRRGISDEEKQTRVAANRILRASEEIRDPEQAGIVLQALQRLLFFPWAELWTDVKIYGWLNVQDLLELSKALQIRKALELANLHSLRAWIIRSITAPDFQSLPALEGSSTEEIMKAIGNRDFLLVFLGSTFLEVRRTYYSFDKNLQHAQEAAVSSAINQVSARFWNSTFYQYTESCPNDFNIFDLFGMAEYDELATSIRHDDTNNQSSVSLDLRHG